MAKIKGFDAKNLFMIVLFAIIGIYLWGTFTTSASGNCTQADVDDEKYNCEVTADTNNDGVLDAANIPREGTVFKTPATTELEGSTLWIIKLFIVGTMVFISYLLVMKFAGGRPSKRDIVALIMLGITVYFIWEYVIVPSKLLEVTAFGDLTLGNIGHKTAQMLGLA